jgi:hypothetical protein
LDWWRSAGPVRLEGAGEHVPLVADPMQAQRLVPELESGAARGLPAEDLVNLLDLGLELRMPARFLLHPCAW